MRIEVGLFNHCFKYQNVHTNHQYLSNFSPKRKMGYSTAMNALPTFPFGQNRTSAAFEQSNEEYTIHKMQRRLFVLWKSATKYKHMQTLSTKQKRALELWEHIRHCSDKKCKRKHCRSSQIILAHFRKCKMSKKCVSCKLCGPVTRRIVQESCGICKMVNTQDGQTRKRKCVNQDMLYKANKKKALVSETTIERGGAATIRWRESVKGGKKEDSLLKFIQTNGMKDYPLRKRHTQQHMNNQTLNLDKPTYLCHPNQVISFETESTNNLLSQGGITFVDKSITEKDKRVMTETSIILSRLKDKTTYICHPNQVISLETKPANNSSSRGGIAFADISITEKDRQAMTEASILLSRLKEKTAN